MNFKDKYTTEDKVKADKTGEEIKKTVITNDTYALSEMLQQLIARLGVFIK